MRFVDFLKATVLLSAGAATLLAALTVISLTRDLENGFPSLLANFAVTTYVTPTTQGLTAGATPSGPAPVSAPAPGETALDPASATTATTAEPTP